MRDLFTRIVHEVALAGLMPEIDRSKEAGQVENLLYWADHADVAYVETAEGIAVSIAQIDNHDPHVHGSVLQIFLTLSTSAVALSRLRRGLHRLGKQHGCQWIYTTKRVAPYKYESTYRPIN